MKEGPQWKRCGPFCIRRSGLAPPQPKRAARSDGAESEQCQRMRLRDLVHAHIARRPRPLHVARVETTLSRGPDRMWYLDEGRLPGD